MPADRTVVTELATALGTLPFRDLASALAARPAEMRIDPLAWDRLDALHRSACYAEDFATAYSNGRAFAASPDGLRGRPPLVVEWTGGRRPGGDEVAPIDLRIDHVYMVSCKYLSANIVNASPARLFHGLLSTSSSWPSTDWYEVVAPTEYQQLYESAVRATGILGLPPDAAALTTADRARLRAVVSAGPRDHDLERAYGRLADAVARASAESWRTHLAAIKPDQMLLRLLRIGNAPYFLLGSHGDERLRLRVVTAWDWRDRYELRDLSVEAVPAGQPKVEWVARYREKGGAQPMRSLRGHVEIRWSHGRFAQPPEAKVYLDTPVGEVPGYHALESSLEPSLDGGPTRLFDL